MAEVLATKANMIRAREAGIYGVKVLDPSTGDTFSASAGDYWTLPDDEVLVGDDGETPCILVTFRTVVDDVLLPEVQ